MIKKHRITVEVDPVKLFDTVRERKGDTSSIGISMTELCLTPKDVHFSTAVGLGLYGIEIVKVEDV